MSDNFISKKGNVKVMYVRPTDEKQIDKKNKHPKSEIVNSSKKEHQWKEEVRAKRSIHDKNERPIRTVWQDKFSDYHESERSDKLNYSVVDNIDPAQLRSQRKDENKIYGVAACQTIFKKRPNAIVRAYFVQKQTPLFRDALRWMATERLAYHVVDNDEMRHISGSDHHGGVCFLIKKRPSQTVQSYLASAPDRDCILAMVGSNNPYNLGGILRTATHFGANAILVRNSNILDSSETVRISEGGTEYLTTLVSDDFAAGLAQLQRNGYTIVALTHQHGKPYYQMKLPKKLILLLTEERDGFPANLNALVDIHMTLPGTGYVDGINISVATGILLAEWAKLARK